MKEISRVDVTDADSFEATCQKCGKVVKLWYNGGELDSRSCCNLRFALETPQIHLVTYEQ